MHLCIVGGLVDLHLSLPDHFWTDCISKFFFDFVGEGKLEVVLDVEWVTSLR
jgi:hypothetical protein